MIEQVGLEVAALNERTDGLTNSFREINEANGGLAAQLKGNIDQVHMEAGNAYQQLRAEMEARHKHLDKQREMNARIAFDVTAVDYKLHRMAEDIGQLSGGQQEQIAQIANGLQTQFNAPAASINQQNIDRHVGAGALTGLAQQVNDLEEQIRQVRDGQCGIEEVTRNLQQASDQTAQTVQQLQQAQFDDVSTMTGNTQNPQAYIEMGSVPPTSDPWAPSPPTTDPPSFARGSLHPIVGQERINPGAMPQPVGRSANNGTYAYQTSDEVAANQAFTEAVNGLNQMRDTVQDAQQLAYMQYGGMDVVQGMADLQERVQGAQGLVDMQNHMEAAAALHDLQYVQDPSNYTPMETDYTNYQATEQDYREL